MDAVVHGVMRSVVEAHEPAGLEQETEERDAVEVEAQERGNPRSCEEDGFVLGRWVKEQRRARRRGWDRLSADRVARLEALPGWGWNLRDTWESWFALLERFVAREGHARVQWKHVEEDRKLGIWARNQRAQFRQGRLSKERADRLRALPDWTWNAKLEPEPIWLLRARRVRPATVEPADAGSDVASLTPSPTRVELRSSSGAQPNGSNNSFHAS